MFWSRSLSWWLAGSPSNAVLVTGAKTLGFDMHSAFVFGWLRPWWGGWCWWCKTPTVWVEVTAGPVGAAWEDIREPSWGCLKDPWGPPGNSLTALTVAVWPEGPWTCEFPCLKNAGGAACPGFMALLNTGCSPWLVRGWLCAENPCGSPSLGSMPLAISGCSPWITCGWPRAGNTCVPPGLGSMALSIVGCLWGCCLGLWEGFMENPVGTTPEEVLVWGCRLPGALLGSPGMPGETI